MQDPAGESASVRKKQYRMSDFLAMRKANCAIVPEWHPAIGRLSLRVRARFRLREMKHSMPRNWQENLQSVIDIAATGTKPAQIN